ncbi:hypothetical protein C0993_000343 [Termitomyces sp. T159_Od127]|nr:hypothetical protein C0993_000343 [Termitomyces sp. T159_Od127]
MMTRQTSTPSIFSSSSSSLSSSTRPTIQHCHELEDQVAALRAQLELVEAQHDSAEVHVVFATHEIAILRNQANRCSEKQAKQGWRINTSARVMTLDEGLREAQKERAKCDEKERKKAERRAKKDAVDQENLICRTTKGAQMIFIGSLGSKNKTELQDLASILSLSIAGTKVNLQQCIEDEFEKRPKLKDEAQFLGLFKQSQKRPAPTNKDMAAGFNDIFQSQPPLQRHRLNTMAETMPSTLYSMQSSLSHPPSSPIHTSSSRAYHYPSQLHVGSLTMMAHCSDCQFAPGSHSLYHHSGR